MMGNRNDMVEKGTFYGVSVGPGDPELLTLAAARILKEADVIASPSIGSGLQTARRIIERFIEGKDVIDCSTPMTRDKQASAQAYDAIADRLGALLDEGKDIAFIALGDAGVYSTYFYIHKRMEARGYHCVVIPGVTSFNAAAARLGVPLCEGSEQVMIVPVSMGDAEAALDVPGVKVFMKSGRDLLKLRDLLRERGRSHDAMMVANCGLPAEQVIRDFDDFDEDSNTMAIVILK